MQFILLFLPNKLKTKLKLIYFYYAFWFYRITGKAPYPRTIIIDPSNICNLNCPLCNNGSGMMKAEKSLMEEELLRKILEEIPTLKHISFFNWGESLLNPKINELLKIIKERNIHVSIHSNLSFEKTDKFWKDFLKTGLDEIEVSLDGTTQGIYEKYRVNGNLKLVTENLKKIIAIKNKKKTDKPRIFWKFMINKFNQNQLEEARELAKKIGVEFETTTISVSEGSPEFKFPGTVEERIEKWIPLSEKKSKARYHKKTKYPLFERKCDQIFSTLAISPTGKVLPCCFVSNDENSFGDISKEPFNEIWNNKKYRYARDLFVKNKTKNKPEESIICEKCNYFEKVR